MQEIILTYITVESAQQAQEIIVQLLEKKLIACATTFASNSFYRWNDSIKQDSEHLIIAKTLPEKTTELKKAIEALHNYEIPCILMFPSKANNAYYNWLNKELAQASH